MKKSMTSIMGLLILMTGFLRLSNVVYASDGEEYITISVEAADNSGTLLYALDSDDPSAFSVTNEFMVPVGTSHTIYVKDAAGNIASQVFTPMDTENAEDTVSVEVAPDDSSEADSSDSEYEYAGDLLKDPAEDGQGTLYDRTVTDANNPDAERLFYTVTTDDGEVFYLVIDQGQSSNNVYLLDQVKLSDLEALAIDDSEEKNSENPDSLLDMIGNGSNGANDNSTGVEEPAETESSQNNERGNKNSFGNIIVLFIILAIGGAVYYYMKIYRNKKNEQMDLVDAMDKDDFAVVDEEEAGEDADFGLDEDYQEKELARLMNDESVDSEADESYAISHKIDNDFEENFNDDDEFDGDDEFDEEE